MSDFKLLSTDELASLVRGFISKKPVTEPDPMHEAWTGELRLTPRMVADIIAANEET
jgi:hypothetical protein